MFDLSIISGFKDGDIDGAVRNIQILYVLASFVEMKHYCLRSDE